MISWAGMMIASSCGICDTEECDFRARLRESGKQVSEGSPRDYARTVPKPIPLTALGLLLSEKQIPQVVVNIKNAR